MKNSVQRQLIFAVYCQYDLFVYLRKSGCTFTGMHMHTFEVTTFISFPFQDFKDWIDMVCRPDPVPGRYIFLQYVCINKSLQIITIILIKTCLKFSEFSVFLHCQSKPVTVHYEEVVNKNYS